MADGLDGLSAYEIAVAAGFRGSVKEWLASLAGARGRDGMAGKDGKSISGPAGKDGRDGKDGISIKGDAGEQGRDGKDGKDAQLPPAVPWMAEFERDEISDRTERITVTPSNYTGRLPWEIVPIRDDFGRAVAATINPSQ
jgi:hypothetical protein